MSGDRLGSIVVDELVFPIVRLELAHGCLVVTGRIVGPCRAVSTGDYVVNGRDGRTVLIARGSRGSSRIAWGPIARGVTLEFTSTIRFEDLGRSTEVPYPGWPGPPVRLDVL